MSYLKKVFFFNFRFSFEKTSVSKFILAFFLLGYASTSSSQVVRYATEQDVINIKNANLGDLLITGGTEMANGIPAIYIMGRDNWVVPPGKKILIKGGIYEWIGIDNASSGTVNNPIVITNYDGQVETKEFKISGLKYFKLSGKYDSLKKTGDKNFPGHDAGYAFSQNKYGIFVNSRWTNESRALLSVTGFTDINGIDQISTDYEIEYVESGNGGYSNLFKWDGKVSIVDNVSIHDCYFHDTGGEGLYLGITDDSKPGQVFRNLSIYNNRLIRTGYDALQLGKVVKGANIYNNVLYGGMNWRSPFMEFQDFGASLNFCDGGINFKNNIIVGGSGAIFQLGLRFQPWYSSIDPVLGNINFENNLFVNTKSSVGTYFNADELSNKGVTLSMKNNDFGGFKNFKYNQVYPNWTSVPFVIKNFSPLAPSLTNNNWDSAGGKTTLYNSDYGLGTLINNQIADIPNPNFVNFLGIADFDYTNLDLWASKTTVGVPGTIITYKAGQFVLWKSKMYKCILENSQVEPGVTSGWGNYWQLMNQPADDVRLLTTDRNFIKKRGILSRDTIIPIVNHAPKSNAGPNKEITLPVNSLIVIGSGTDLDGTISGYQWNKIAGPSSFSIVNPTSATTTINNLVAGDYQFELVVADNMNATGRDTVLIKVNALVNQSPKSNAGTDKEITLPVNSLSIIGSGTDVDGTISGYQWNKIAGPSSFSIVNPNNATTTISNLVAGNYQFELVVTDNMNATGRDTVLIKVNALVNQAPTSNAGPNKEITLPVNSLSIIGSGTDTDGTISGYQWNKIAGPSSFSIVNPNNAITTITNLVAGNYQFELVVTDNMNATGRDTVLIKVNALVNQAPTSNAGTDKEITLPVNSLSIIGSGTDTDGTISSYQWNKIAGPSSFSIVNPNNATTTISNLVAGDYQFELVVTDNMNATGRDTVLVRVNQNVRKNKHQKPVRLAVYPNPAISSTNIIIDDLNEINKVQIQIIDLYGKIVYSKEFNNIENMIAIKLDINSFLKGIHKVQVISNSTVIKTVSFLKL